MCRWRNTKVPYRFSRMGHELQRSMPHASGEQRYRHTAKQNGGYVLLSQSCESLFHCDSLFGV
jgi:hypothetical protein